jgi:hypothetical protein
MDVDYGMVTTLIATGFVAWLISYASKPLFVNRSDKDNPFRIVVVVLGYIGIGLIIWGLVILVAQIT